MDVSEGVFALAWIAVIAPQVFLSTERTQYAKLLLRDWHHLHDRVLMRYSSITGFMQNPMPCAVI
jgi:hypothetical protein